MGSEHVTTDLDAVIAAAVTARVESEVMKALSGDEVIGRFVTAALTAPVEVKDGLYGRSTRTTFVGKAVMSAIQNMTRQAVTAALKERESEIQAAVQAAILDNLGPIAKGLVDGLGDAAQSSYRLSVKLVRETD